MLVWLLGGASTGKSSIARRILGRAEPGEAWILTGDEHVTSRIPRRLITPRASEAEPPSDGWDILVVDRQLQRLPKVGPVGMRILDAMYRGAAAMAEAGVHVVLEDVIWEPQVCDLALRALGDAPRLVVELWCDPGVRLERERARGDRYVGAVAAFAEGSVVPIAADLRLDTTHRSPGDCADEIVALVRSRAAPRPLT